MHTALRSIHRAKALTSVCKRNISQRRTLSNLHRILSQLKTAGDRNLSSQHFPQACRTTFSTSIFSCSDRVLMDVDTYRQDPAGVATGDASPHHDSSTHDLDRAEASLKALPAECISPGSSPRIPQAGDEKSDDAYTKRGYTSEIFKIELSNLPKKVGYKVSTRSSCACISFCE